jgi:hypothetical protein
MPQLAALSGMQLCGSPEFGRTQFPVSTKARGARHKAIHRWSKLFENCRIQNGLVVGQQEDFRYHFCCLRTVVGERKEDSATMLRVHWDVAQVSAWLAVNDPALQMDRIGAEATVELCMPLGQAHVSHLQKRHGLADHMATNNRWWTNRREAAQMAAQPPIKTGAVHRSGAAIAEPGGV